MLTPKQQQQQILLLFIKTIYFSHNPLPFFLYRYKNLINFVAFQIRDLFLILKKQSQ
jgi:hypothetical protein